MEDPLERSGNAGKPGKIASWRGGAATTTLLFTLVVFLAGFAVISGIAGREHANAQLAEETQELAIPTVSVIHPKPAAPQQEIILPGNVQPYMDAPIYARTNGYLKKWYADIGTRVKAGQLLAEIDSPEVDQELQQARADLATAEANLRLAQITAARYKDLMKTQSVSQQDVDNATGNFQARQAAVESARFNVKRLQNMQSFEKIYAPFDGVITARHTDIGDLINSGSGGGLNNELFHIMAINRLRVYVNVPEVYSRDIRPGLHAYLTLDEFPGRKFDGVLVRDSDAMDNATRTLLTEVDVDNRSGALKPGDYAEVHFKLPSEAATFTVPINSLIFRAGGLQVATVTRSNQIALIPITPGRDFGTEMEVTAGLTGKEFIVENPPDSLVNGETVQVPKATTADQEDQ